MIRFALAAAAALAFGAPASAQETGPWAPAILQSVAAFDRDTPAERLAALTAMLKARGLPYEIQTFRGGTASAPAEGRNVVVTLGAGEKDVVVGAHYDAVVLRNGRLADGLVDNAASVVALAEVANALKSRPLKHRVRIVFFDQEEIGLLGAKAYLASRKREELAAMINLDVNAYGDTVLHSAPAGDVHKPLLRALREGCAKAGRVCVGAPKYPPSDYMPFEAAGVPTVSISVFPEAEAHQLWLMLNTGDGNSGLAEGFAPKVFRTIHSEADNLQAVEPGAIELAIRTTLHLIVDADAALSSAPTGVVSDPAARAR